MIKSAIPFLIVFLTLPGCSQITRLGHSIAGVKKIQPEALRTILRDPNILLLDVRDVPDWNLSKEKIIGAKREPPNDVDLWKGTYLKDQEIILY
jgi:hypothetical protein